MRLGPSSGPSSVFLVILLLADAPTGSGANVSHVLAFRTIAQRAKRARELGRRIPGKLLVVVSFRHRLGVRHPLATNAPD